jgi:hypothetical protein
VLRISKRPEPVNIVHCPSCTWHEPFCYSRRHRPTPKNTLRGNPGCAVGPKIPTARAWEVCHRHSRLGKVGIVAGGGTPAGATPRLAPPRSRRCTRASGIPHRGRLSQICCCRRTPSEPPPLQSKPIVPRTTVVATRPRVRRCHSSASERRRRSILGERHRRSPSSGRHRRGPRDRRR